MEVEIINLKGKVLHKQTIDIVRGQWAIVNIVLIDDQSHYDVVALDHPKLDPDQFKPKKP